MVGNALKMRLCGGINGLIKPQRLEKMHRGDWGWLGHVLVGTVPLCAKRIARWRNYIYKICFGEQVMTTFTGATCIIDARFASEI